ncbi:MAG: 6-phosphofructokinase [Desulfosarcinaceae bacterium]|nr:6-phosphofructokinase [Desulfosarcinaceae bacterium]
MQNTPHLPLEELLADPDVQAVISNTNAELIERRSYQPPACSAFEGRGTELVADSSYTFEIDREARRQLSNIIDNPVQEVRPTEAPSDNFLRPRRIGIVFSGGPAPGGHNVIAGLYDAAMKANPQNEVVGFLVGPDGIIQGDSISITAKRVDRYRNLGGFTMLKTGRTKIDTPKKMALSRQTLLEMQLDALVVVGGDDSNTNAAFLAQELYDSGIQVIGVPKTIDGDIQVRDAAGHVLCAMSFGFHTAARAFSQEISNLCTDSSSDIKYWHICKVMGRVASHLALEVALQTHANLCLVGEDLADYVDIRRLKRADAEGTIDYTAYGMTLRHVSRVICDAIIARAAVGKNYGVMVLPEGLLEFINEIQVFIIKLNTIIAQYNNTHDLDFHAAFPRLQDKLEYLRRLVRGIRKDLSYGVWNDRDDELFNDMPSFFQEGLLTERDSHGNFQFSQVPTEEVLLGMVRDYLGILREKGRYKVGVHRRFVRKTLKRGGLDPDLYGPAVFQNYGNAEYLLTHDTIISLKTLRQALERAGVLTTKADIPAAVEKCYLATVPKFKTQTHFYGYDGRGADPTRFDCMYGYNLGLTVFSLIANGATGQMAAIRNLEHDFKQWTPIGIPIAPLMHLEERKGRLALVIEKALVDVKAPAFRIAAAYRDKWLAATANNDQYRRPGPIRFTGKSEEDRPITLRLNSIGHVLANGDPE